jgi:hypothetical protein
MTYRYAVAALFACSAVFSASAADAQEDWQVFDNLCNAVETENPGSPISCIFGEDVVGVATNSGDRRSYNTQLFRDELTEFCIEQDPAHPWFDEVVGLCKVEIVWVEPNTGINSTIWVRFGETTEHGELGGATGLFVFVQKVSCDCYGRRPPSPPP